MAIRVKQNGKWINVKAQQDLDTSLSIEGMAADAKAVGDKIDELPIAVYENYNGKSFTEILGQRSATNIRMSKVQNQIQIRIDLEDGETIFNYIDLNANGFPTAISTNNTFCNLDWSGF